MGKPTICIGENKDADQLRGNREADQRLCFRYSDSTIPLLLKSKIQASSSFLCLYRPVCVRPVRKPHCWFSHGAAHLPVHVGASSLMIYRRTFMLRITKFCPCKIQRFFLAIKFENFGKCLVLLFSLKTLIVGTR